MTSPVTPRYMPNTFGLRQERSGDGRQHEQPRAGALGSSIFMDATIFFQLAQSSGAGYATGPRVDDQHPSAPPDFALLSA